MSAQPTWYATVSGPANRKPLAANRTLAEADILKSADRVGSGPCTSTAGSPCRDGPCRSDDRFGVVVFAADDEIGASSSAAQMPGVAAGIGGVGDAPFDVMLRAPMTPVQTFAYRLLPTRADILLTGPTEREAELMMAHWGYCEQLYAEGRLVFAGRSGRPGRPVCPHRARRRRPIRRRSRSWPPSRASWADCSAPRCSRSKSRWPPDCFGQGVRARRRSERRKGCPGRGSSAT